MAVYSAKEVRSNSVFRFLQDTECDVVERKFLGNEFQIVGDETEKGCLVSDRCFLGFASRDASDDRRFLEGVYGVMSSVR